MLYLKKCNPDSLHRKLSTAAISWCLFCTVLFAISPNLILYYKNLLTIENPSTVYEKIKNANIEWN